ncbi:MAG: YdeI/OmpD-associated family protein [Actinomycetota bacterium]|nr:YdeI/OmpD-associated family protein [Actinomycetota bacterium]
MNDEPVFFEDPAGLRAWFAAHAHEGGELFVGFHKVGTGRGDLTWSQAVDQAVCFGWVTQAKRPETRVRRLAALIDDSATGRRLHRYDRGR